MPGMALPSETDLSTELEVSRTVVREAIKVLAAKGLVEARPKTGTQVLARSHWDLVDPDVLEWTVERGATESFYHDLFEVRALFEGRAAELAAERRSEEEMERIEALLAEMAVAVSRNPAYIEADLRFHGAILTATHNELLGRLTSTLAVALQAARRITTRVPGGPSQSIPLHRAVSDAIRMRDARAAREAMLALIAFATRDMEEVLGLVNPSELGQRGSNDPPA